MTARSMSLALVFVLLVLPSRAHAYEPPVYRAGVLVHAERSSDAQRQEIRALSRQAEPRVYVVVADTRDDLVYMAEAETQTEDALEQTWDAWARASFDTERACLMVVGLDERRVQVRCGTWLDIDLGLHTRRIAEITDARFVPAARRGDYPGAISAIIQGLQAFVAEVREAPVYELPQEGPLQEVEVLEIPGRFELAAKLPSGVHDHGRGLVPRVIAVGRGPEASVLAREGLSRWRSQLPPEDAERLVVIAYVWSTDELAVAMAPEALALVEDGEERLQALVSAQQEGEGTPAHKMSTLLAQLQKRWLGPVGAALEAEHRLHSSFRPEPDRHLYTTPELGTSASLERALAEQPLLVRAQVVAALHDGVLLLLSPSQQRQLLLQESAEWRELLVGHPGADLALTPRGTAPARRSSRAPGSCR